MKGWRVIRNDKGWSRGDTHFQFRNNKLEFSIRGNSPQDQWFAFKFEEFTWYHIAVVFSRTGRYVKLYVNGKFEEQKTYRRAIQPMLDDFEIGAWNRHRFFKGVITDLRVWKQVRS